GSRLLRAAGSDHGQDRIARGEDRRGAVHSGLASRLRDSASAARRHLDHPALACDLARALHALVQRAGASCGLGGGACSWNLHGGDARFHHFGISVDGVWSDDPRLCRALLGGRKFAARDRAYAAVQPAPATKRALTPLIDRARETDWLMHRRQSVTHFLASTLDPRGVTR